MKRGFACAGILVVFFPAMAQGAGTRYRLVEVGFDLPTTGAGSGQWGTVCGATETGMVCIEADSVGVYRWTQAGGLELLAGTGPHVGGYAGAMNEAGDVAGMANATATLWWGDGHVSTVGQQENLNTSAEGVNSAGCLVGSRFDLSTYCEAFFWSEGTGLRLLGHLGDVAGTGSSASDVNDHGQVVGCSSPPTGLGEAHAFLWTQEGGMVDLGPGAGSQINNAGQVLVYNYTPETGLKRFLWSEQTGMVPLPSWSWGWDLTEDGVVFGNASYAKPARWSLSRGVEYVDMEVPDWFDALTAYSHKSVTIGPASAHGRFVAGSLEYDDPTRPYIRIYAPALWEVLPDPGDTNRDGQVDALDYIALKRNLGTRTNATWEMGDFDGDGDVDRADLLTLKQNFGGASPAAGAERVPEPASLAVLGLAALAVMRRRGKRRS